MSQAFWRFVGPERRAVAQEQGRTEVRRFDCRSEVVFEVDACRAPERRKQSRHYRTLLAAGFMLTCIGYSLLRWGTIKSQVKAAALCLFTLQPGLKGDGVIGVPAPGAPARTVIETDGSTSLIEAGSKYFIQPDGGPAVELSFGGSAVVDGEFDQPGGHWVPIAAEQTATGYEVAWKVEGADEYRVWYTDASGKFRSSALATASGSSVALASFESSFQQDLNGDGAIGVSAAALGEQPQFIYRGIDCSGAQLYDVTWDKLGSHSFAVRVLTPTHPSSDYPHSFLFTLPVEPGLAQPNYGRGLDELAKLDIEDQYNTTIIEPIFPKDSWYADNSKDPTTDYETFVASTLTRWADSNLSTTRAEKNLLIGFSKSGYGAIDLLLKHPDTFDAAAAFDFPARMRSYDAYGASSSAAYGTQANFQEKYELTDSFINKLKAPFTLRDRILISEGPVFTSQMVDFDALLTSQGVTHTFLTQTKNAHTWFGGWLPGAVAGLFGLAQNLKGVASTSPSPDRLPR